jgi:uncharacterized protein affecting Mg2+/Co2+ transport
MNALCRKFFLTVSGQDFNNRSFTILTDLLSISSFGNKFNGSRVSSARSYHTRLNLEKEERIRLTTLRLYRILQRTCTEFETKAPGNDSIILQPPLEAPDWGRHVMYTSPAPAQIEDLFRLFYTCSDTVDERDLRDDSSDHEGGDNTVATPTARTALSASATVSSEPSATYNPSPIDYWYYELVSKSKEEKVNHEDVDDGGNDDSFRSLPFRKFMSCWTSQKQIQEAVRTAFRTLRYKSLSDQDQSSLLTSTDLHKWAIKAIQSLREQQTLWTHSSVATTDGVVRVVATSSFIGRTAPLLSTMPPAIVTPRILADSSPKYRFAYRIRVENVSDDQTVQVLGRYWHIAEEPVMLPSMEGSISDEETFPPIVIDSPKTGVVGQHPVLQPGQIFEYMSGTDLAKPNGTMQGHLYMVRVPSTSKGVKSGEGLEATSATKGDQEPNEALLFDAAVAPFRLEA